MPDKVVGFPKYDDRWKDNDFRDRTENKRTRENQEMGTEDSPIYTEEKGDVVTIKSAKEEAEPVEIPQPAYIKRDKEWNNFIMTSLRKENETPVMTPYDGPKQPEDVDSDTEDDSTAKAA